MLRRFLGIASGFRLVPLLSGCLLFLQVAASYAALSCNAQSGITTIGLEWVAKQCIPDGMNDNVSIYYENNMLEPDWR